MTFKLFGRTLSFGIRNGVGIDLEFPSARAMWISKDMETLEAAAFQGTVISLPFSIIMFGRCYELEDYTI